LHAPEYVGNEKEEWHLTTSSLFLVFSLGYAAPLGASQLTFCITHGTEET